MCADLAERRGDDSISGKKSFDIYYICSYCVVKV